MKTSPESPADLDSHRRQMQVLRVVLKLCKLLGFRFSIAGIHDFWNSFGHYSPKDLTAAVDMLGKMATLEKIPMEDFREKWPIMLSYCIGMDRFREATTCFNMVVAKYQGRMHQAKVKFRDVALETERELSHLNWDRMIGQDRAALHKEFCSVYIGKLGERSFTLDVGPELTPGQITTANKQAVLKIHRELFKINIGTGGLPHAG